MTSATGPQISLEYHQGLPAWRVSLANAKGLKEVKTSLAFEAFFLAKGSLIGLVLRVYDIPDRPLYFHRILDVSDPAVQRYLQTLATKQRMVLIAEDMEGGQPLTQSYNYSDMDFASPLSQSLAHNQALAGSLDGKAALEIFLAVFKPQLKETNQPEKAWAEAKRLLGVPPAGQPAAIEPALAASNLPLPMPKPKGKLYRAIYILFFLLIGLVGVERIVEDTHALYCRFTGQHQCEAWFCWRTDTSYRGDLTGGTYKHLWYCPEHRPLPGGFFYTLRGALNLFLWAAASAYSATPLTKK